MFPAQRPGGLEGSAVAHPEPLVSWLQVQWDEALHPIFVEKVAPHDRCVGAALIGKGETIARIVAEHYFGHRNHLFVAV